MATKSTQKKKKTTTKAKSAVKKTTTKAKASTKAKNSAPADKHDEFWHNAAWLIIIGIALGICIGYTLSINN